MANRSDPHIDWLHTRLGERVLFEEQPHLNELVRRFHGDTLVWSGQSPVSAATVNRCMVRNCFYIAAPPSSAHPHLSTFHSSLSTLALPNHVADGFVLHHSLEVEDDPRQALREVGRVMAPGGRLVICAFNSLSLWGLRRLYGRIRPDLFSNMKFLNPIRLQDWLTLLGFELDGPVVYLAYGAPFLVGRGELSPVGRLLKNAQPPCGGVYILTAVKQAHGMRWDWRKPRLAKAELAPVAYPKLAAWNRVERGR